LLFSGKEDLGAGRRAEIEASQEADLEEETEKGRGVVLVARTTAESQGLSLGADLEEGTKQSQGVVPGEKTKLSQGVLRKSDQSRQIKQEASLLEKPRPGLTAPAKQKMLKQTAKKFLQIGTSKSLS